MKYKMGFADMMLNGVTDFWMFTEVGMQPTINVLFCCVYPIRDCSSLHALQSESSCLYSLGSHSSENFGSLLLHIYSPLLCFNPFHIHLFSFLMAMARSTPYLSCSSFHGSDPLPPPPFFSPSCQNHPSRKIFGTLAFWVLLLTCGIESKLLKLIGK